MRCALLILLILFALPCAACLWDYDTLAQESAGMPDVKAVIAGGFPRNPPLYYEMRLERVTKLLAANPDDLDAYDGAAVACDRLGRHDEAIGWMAKKLAAMDRMGYDSAAHEQPNHRYRYLANLGTFYAHRWFKNGANRDDMADMQRGRDLIEQAIKENPDAHFGREKYQLMAMEWVIELDPFDESIPFSDGSGMTTRGTLPNMLGLKLRQALRIRDDDSNLIEVGLGDAIPGLSGLIVQGNAWESVDVYYALALAIQVTGRSSLAALAFNRCRELVEQGRTSVVPNAPSGAELLKVMNPDSEAGLFEQRLEPGVAGPIGAKYQELRSAADVWQKSRISFMQAALESGKHPDTHPDFWSGFQGNPDRMEIPEQGAVSSGIDGFFTWLSRDSFGFWAIASLLLITTALILGVAVAVRSTRSWLRRRAAWR